MPVKVLLAEIRKSKGLSQNDLARLTGMSPQNIQKIEQGEAKSLTFKTLESFCQALHCQPGDILIYEDEPQGEPQVVSQKPKEVEKVKPSEKNFKRSSPRNLLCALQRTQLIAVELNRQKPAL